MGCGDSSKSKQTSTSYTPEQQKWLAEALDLYGKQLGQNNNVYQGQRLADFSGLQNGALDAASGVLTQFAGDQSVDTPLFNETGAAINSILNGETGAQKITDEQTADYFNTKIKQPALQSLKDDIMPAIDESYAGGNFFSTARSKARTDAATDISNQLSEQNAQLNWDVLQNNQAVDNANANRILSATSQAMNYSQLPAQETMNNLKIAASQVNGMEELFGLGQQEQTQEQRELETAIAKFAEENQITDAENLSILLSLLSMNYSTSSGSSSGPGLGYAMATSAVGGFASGFGSQMAKT